mgnify:CR=1 FL=1
MILMEFLFKIMPILLELIAKRLPSYSFDIIMKSAEKESISYNIKNELVPALNQIIDEIETK